MKKKPVKSAIALVAFRVALTRASSSPTSSVFRP